jgi:hypothetical protein
VMWSWSPTSNVYAGDIAARTTIQLEKLPTTDPRSVNGFVLFQDLLYAMLGTLILNADVDRSALNE